VSHKSERFGFDVAIQLLKKGKKVTRGELPGQYLFCGRQCGADLLTVSVEELQKAVFHPPAMPTGDMRCHIFLVNRRGRIVPSWEPEQADVFAEDWSEVHDGD